MNRLATNREIEVDFSSPSLDLAQIEAELDYCDNLLAFDAWLMQQRQRNRNAAGFALFAAASVLLYLLGIWH